MSVSCGDLQEKFCQPPSEIEKSQVTYLLSEFPHEPTDRLQKLVGQSRILTHQLQ